MLQFWNMFNARYFRTGRSLINDIVDLIKNPKDAGKHFSSGFLLIAAIILIGQFAIVNYAGPFFDVSSLSIKDWGCIVSFTALVLIIPDIVRFVASSRKRIL